MADGERDELLLISHGRRARPHGLQHALHKEAVRKLASQRGIYLGQILAGTPFDDFFDQTNRNSRLNQYQIEKYLQATDDGWIFRRARYYRGAIQSEDEETFQRGQQVRIIRGPFEGMEAIFDQHLSGRDRIRVFFDLVNRMQVSVEMDKGDLLPPS